MKTIEGRAIRNANDNGYDGNARDASIGSYMLGATDQKVIDDAELAEVKRQRDEYYDELLKLRQQKAIGIDKAKRAFCKAKECVPYDECHRANGGCFAMQRFIQAMEE